MWIWCLLKATHKPYKLMVGLTEIELKEGQFITGRNKGAEELDIKPSTFYKHMKALQDMGMISLNSNNKMTLVTIENWRKYQLEEIQSNNKVTTKEQQSNTNNNNNNIIIKDIVEYLNLTANKSFNPTTKDTIRHISARLNEGHTLEDFKTVIDKKTQQWKGTNFEMYIRPQTLFGTKFESYLNETTYETTSSSNDRFVRMEELF